MTLRQLMTTLDDATRARHLFEVFDSKTNSIVEPDGHDSRKVVLVGVTSQASLFDEGCDALLVITI